MRTSLTGMAYVYDDYGRIIAYTVDENGQKQLVQSIQIMEDGGTRTIYKDKQTVDDENGLPIYYTDGRLVTKEERWETVASTDPYGNPETEAAPTRSHVCPLEPIFWKKKGYRTARVTSRQDTWA